MLEHVDFGVKIEHHLLFLIKVDLSPLLGPSTDAVLVRVCDIRRGGLAVRVSAVALAHLAGGVIGVQGVHGAGKGPHIIVRVPGVDLGSPRT